MDRQVGMPDSADNLTVVSVQDAKTHLLKLVTRSAAGEEIVISKRGEPMCKLVPVTKHPELRRQSS